MIRPRVGKRVHLVGLEMAQNLWVDVFVLEAWTFLHYWVDGVDLQQLVRALMLGAINGVVGR